MQLFVKVVAPGAGSGRPDWPGAAFPYINSRAIDLRLGGNLLG